MPASPFLRYLRSAALAAILVAAAPALSRAQDTGAADDARRELAGIESSISVNQEKVDQLRQEIENMKGDRAQQNAALIASAQRAKLAEIEVSAAEELLAGLRAQESEIKGRLDGQNASIASVLGALQRIARNPPPAVVINPSDALSSARAAILLSDVLPEISDKARAIARDLADLSAVRQSAENEANDLTLKYSALAEEQLRIATLIEARRRGVAKASAQLQAEEQQAADLAARALSLNQLIATLSDRVASVSEAARAASAAPGATGALDPDALRLALANTGRSEPAFPFASGRGLLTMPATGVAVSDFGADDGFGGRTQGASLVTRADAQVVAPADGWVMYKGPYLNYGQIVILNPGQNYSILLAGLAEVDVDLGQFVLMGEPLGKMGSRTIGQAITTSAGVSRPTLYIEIRNESGPIDPSGWWAKTQEQTKNG